MEKLRAYAQTANVTFESWIGTFMGILLIRILFEHYSSYLSNHYVLIDIPTIIHYGAAYLAVNIAIMAIFAFFARTNLKEVLVVGILGFLVILIPPIIDLIFAGVGGHTMSYIFASGSELLIKFFTFFGGHISSGITLGIQVELILGIIFCFMYVKSATGNIKRALAAALTFYCVLFFLSSMPSIVAIVQGEGSNPLASTIDSVANSHIIANNLHPELTGTDLALFNFAFNKMMVGVATLIAIIGSIILCMITAKERFIALVKNSRPERIFYFILLLGFGMALAKTPLSSNWLDILSYILAIIALKCAAMFSICQNDIYDEEIDAISNPNRPLVNKKLSKDEMQLASKIFLLFTFLACYGAGNYVMFFTFLTLFVYFIYSNPPLRLKQFTLLNPFLVSIACLAMVMEGFFILSPEKSIIAFPVSLAFAIIIFHTAVTNIRDIKDAEGDKANGIKTLPVLLGVKKSKRLIAGIICIFYLLMPSYFHISWLYIPAIVASIMSWYFINQENYKEWKAFVAYMIYLVLIILGIILK